MSLFSVLIPSYNRPELIGETVGSILKNDFDDFELVISDDKSPRQDEVVQALQPFLCDARVHLHLQPVNLGEPGNRDFLFRVARGEWLIVLGDDDQLCPQALSTLASAIPRYPGAGIYAFGYEIIDEFGRVCYSRRAPKPLRLSVLNPRLAREIVVAETLPFWMYHPATFCARKAVHNRIKSSAEVGIGDDFMFMIDFINDGGVLQVVPAVLMCYRKASSSARHAQLNLSAGELPQLVARARIMEQLSLRSDLHPAIASFVRSGRCRARLLYDPILWSTLGIESLAETLGLSSEVREELHRHARRRPRALYRRWQSLRRALFFTRLFGFAGLREMSRVSWSRLTGPRQRSAV